MLEIGKGEKRQYFQAIIIKEKTPFADIGFLIKAELAEHYQRTLQSISPLQWCDWFQLDFENVFTQVKLVRGARRKVFAKAVEEEEK